MNYNNHFFSCDGFSVEMGRFGSIRGRLFCLFGLFKIILALVPLLLCKSILTVFRVIGFVLGVVFLVITLGMLESAKKFFLCRVFAFTRDLAQWALFPFMFGTDLLRLVLGCVIHPAIIAGI